MSKKIKGITIDIDGNTTGLSKALTQINSQSKTLQTDLTRIDRLLKLDPGNVELTAEKHKTLADAIENTEKHLDALKNAKDDVEKAFQSGDIGKKQYLDFQEALIKTENQLESLKNKQSSISSLSDAFAKAKNKVSDLGDTISDKIPPSVKKVGDDFKQIGTELNTVKTKLTPVVEKVEDMAVKAGKAAVEIGKIGAGTAKAGIEAVGTAADVAAKGLMAYSTAATGLGAALFGLSANAASAADDINTLATQTGLSTEEIQKFQYASDIIDVDLETLTGSMAKLTKNMGTAQKGTGDAANAFKELGISIVDESGQLRNNQEVFDEAIAALAEMENETQRDAYAMQIFGKSAQDLNPLIEGGAEQLKNLGDSAEKAGLILSQDALDDLNAFNDSIDILKSNATATGRIVGGAFAGSFQKFTDVAGNSLPKAGELFAGLFDAENYEDNFDEFAEGLADFGAEILELLEEALPTFLDGFNGLVLGIVSGVAENLPETIETLLPILLDGFFGLVEGLTEYLPTLLPLITEGALTLFLGLLDGINGVLDILIPMLPGIVQQITNSLVVNLPLIISAGIELLSGLITALGQITDQLLPMLPVLISQVSDALISNLPFLITTGFELLLGLIEGITNCIPDLIDTVTELVPVIVDTLTEEEMLTKLVSAALELMLALALGLVDAIPDLIEVIPDIIMAVVEAFLEQDWGSIGIDIMRGIGEGLWAGLEAIADTITDVCEAIWDDIKDFFGIASPSKLFRDEVGLYLAQGIGVGFEDEMPNVEAQMQEALPTEFDIDTDVNASGHINGIGISGSSAFAGANININIEGMNIASDYDVERFVAILDEKLADLAIQQSRAIGE